MINFNNKQPTENVYNRTVKSNQLYIKYTYSITFKISLKQNFIIFKKNYSFLNSLKYNK